MFAEVALHRKLPRGLDLFTYEIPSDAHVMAGQLIQVPFRNQTLAAVVRKIHSQTPNYPTKEIVNISETLLTTTQMAVAEWMSLRYHTSFAKTIDLFIPEKIWPKETARRSVRQKIKAAADDPEKITPASPEKNAKYIEELTELIDGLFKEKNTLILTEHYFPRDFFYKLLSEKTAGQKNLLVLFPEQSILETYAKNKPQYSSECSEQEKAELWREVAAGNITSIFGTRGALFLPFKKLDGIILDLEENEQYQERRAPAYQSLEVAKELAKLWDIPLIIISSSPSVDTWKKMNEGAFKCIKWNKNEKTRIEIIDMADERRRGSDDALGYRLRERIAATLADRKQVLLFINQRGDTSTMLCKDCGEIVRCDKCQSPLTLHADAMLRCHRCKTEKPLFKTCMKCGGFTLKKLGFGTERLEREVSETFSNARTLRVDSDSTKKIDIEALHKADIIIGTQMVDKPLLLPRLTLRACVMPDPLLHFPDYRASVRLMQILRHMETMASGGEVLVQTYLPTHSIFTSFAEKNLSEFYQSELKTRAMLKLPPYGNIIT